MNLQDAIRETQPSIDLAEATRQTEASTEPFQWDFNWGNMLKNIPGSVGRIWEETASAAFTQEGRAAIGQLVKEAGMLGKVIAQKDPATMAGELGKSEFKLLPQTFKFYAENYNITTREGREKFQRYVEENPAEVLADAISIASMGAGQASKVALISKLNASKYMKPVRFAGAVVEGAVDPTSIVPRAIAPLGQGSPSYNPEMTATYGRNPDRSDVVSTRRVAEIAEDLLGEGQGTSRGDVPAMILSDSGDTQIREGIQMHTPGEVEQTARGRFDTTKANIEEAQTGLIDTQGTSPDYDPFDPVGAGDQVISNFRDVQLGDRAQTRALFEELETMQAPDSPYTIMDQPVPRVTEQQMVDPRTGRIPETYGDLDVVVADRGYAPYFDKTQQMLFELSKSDSKLLTNADYNKTREIINAVIETAEAGGFTVRDFDKMRTNFRQQMDLALRNGEVSPTGSGTVATKMYSALTEDMYNMLERVAPPDFVEKVRTAKQEYLNIIAREDTRVGKFLIKNQANPRRLIDSILKGDLIRNSNDFADLSTLIGEQGMRDLKPALLSRLFDTSLRQGNWSPTGLRSAIAGVNSANKNKLRMLFGDNTARTLAELSELSARFQRESRVKTNSPTGFINRIKGTGTASSIAVRLAELGSIFYYGGFDPQKSAGLAVAFGAVNYFGSKGVDAWMNSVNGRRMMLEGGLQLGDYVITEAEFRQAIQAVKAAGKGVQRTQRAAQSQSRSMRELERRFGTQPPGVYRYVE